jgi:hypothetical protein
MVFEKSVQGRGLQCTDPEPGSDLQLEKCGGPCSWSHGVNKGGLRGRLRTNTNDCILL